MTDKNKYILPVMFFFFVFFFFIATTASAPFSTIATYLSVAMVFAIFVMAIKHWMTQDEQRKALAIALQLTYTSGCLEGLYNGFAVSVMFQSGRVARTEITTRFNKPMPNGLRIYRATAILSDIGKLLGGQDIQTQDAVFDDAFIVKGQPEAHVERLLTRRVRAAVIRADAVAKLELNEKEIVFNDLSFINDASQIRKILDAQHEVAKALCDAA